jgi:hypothetical protein
LDIGDNIVNASRSCAAVGILVRLLEIDRLIGPFHVTRNTAFVVSELATIVVGILRPHIVLPAAPSQKTAARVTSVVRGTPQRPRPYSRRGVGRSARADVGRLESHTIS